MIVSDQPLTAIATAALPTFAVLIGILVNNQRLNDVMRVMDTRFVDTNRHIDELNQLLYDDISRVRQVLGARPKQPEERL